MLLAPDYRRVEMKLPNDSRALPAVETAVELLARRAGMPDARLRAFARAIEEVCRAALAGQRDGSLGVTVEGFADRVEVRLESHAPRLRALARKKAGALARISRVRVEKAERGSRLVLIERVKSRK